MANQNLLDLAGYEAAVGAVLGAAIDPLSWPTDVVDAGLRAALAEYSEAAAPVETTFTVTAAGYLQDLGVVEGGISDLRRVAALGWPWDGGSGQPGCTFAGASERPGLWARWWAVGPGLVRFLDVAPSIGDCLLVRYWREYVIEGLDEEVVVPPAAPVAPGPQTGFAPAPEPASNVPLCDQFLLCVGAAGHACSVRLRQLSEQPGVEARTIAELTARRDGLLAGYAQGLERLGLGGGLGGGVSWGNIGL